MVSPGEDGPSTTPEPGPRALEIATGKAQKVAHAHPHCWVLAADTLVWLEGKFFPKPRDRDQADHFLAELTDHTHQVWTGVCLVAPGGETRAQADLALVKMAQLGPEERNSYLDTAEWVGKAGGYAIQGAAGQFAEVLEGEVETVVGLSGQTVRTLLRQAGTCLEEFCG